MNRNKVRFTLDMDREEHRTFKKWCLENDISMRVATEQAIRLLMSKE